MAARASTSLTAELDRALARRAAAGAPGGTASRLLASGEGWSVHDVVCTAGPDDRPYEERHSRVGIAVVAAGAFHYRSESGRELLTPGSLLLGNAGACFECGHEHGAGDRCIAFQFERELFERLAADAGAGAADRRFRLSRLPPLRPLASITARAASGLLAAPAPPDALDELAAAWEELAFRLAASAVEIAVEFASGRAPRAGAAPPDAEAKIARAVRRIEHAPDADHSLSSLARDAQLSPFHFLRSFERVTGTTPHQFVLRARLRAAALALAGSGLSERGERVVDVAFEAGFGDLSNFNRSFRSEFGASPTAFARRLGGAPLGARAQREAGGTIPFRRA